MNKTALISLSVIGLSSSLHLLDAESSQAATVFSSLAAFEAALSSPSTVIDDYNDFNSFSLFTTPLDRGSYSFTDGVGTNFSTDGTNGNNIDGTGLIGFGFHQKAPGKRNPTSSRVWHLTV